MELAILKNFINMNVEMLVAGVWVEGHLASIAKEVITLLPVGEAKNFYGPTALKIEVVQAIRQVRHLPTVVVPVPPAAPPEVVSTVQPGGAPARGARPPRSRPGTNPTS